MWNPFDSSPDSVPSEGEVEEMIFKNTAQMRQVPQMMHSLIMQAYMAGEKAAQEGEGETDTTKLAMVGAVGFMLAFVLIKSGIMPT